MIGIIGAMDSEVSILKGNIAELKAEKISGIEFFSGKIFGKDVVVAKSGIGKVFATICATAMILNYHPEKIIHIGIAGALSSDLGIRDVAIANAVVQYDIDQTAFNMPMGFIQDLELVEIPCSKTLVTELESCTRSMNIHYKTGIIASGDRFISSEKDKKIIEQVFGAIAVEMEGAATGQVCYVNNVDFCVVRAMSDKANDDSLATYQNEKNDSSDVATQIILQYLYNGNTGVDKKF